MCIKSLIFIFIYVDSYLCNFVFMFILTDILLILSLKKLKPRNCLVSFTKGKKKLQGKCSSKAEWKNNLLTLKCLDSCAIITLIKSE